MKKYYCNICNDEFYGHESIHVSNRHPTQSNFAWSVEI